MFYIVFGFPASTVSIDVAAGTTVILFCCACNFRCIFKLLCLRLSQQQKVTQANKTSKKQPPTMNHSILVKLRFSIKFFSEGLFGGVAKFSGLIEVSK